MRTMQQFGVAALLLGGALYLIQRYYELMPKIPFGGGTLTVRRPEDLWVYGVLGLGVLLFLFGTFGLAAEKAREKDKSQDKPQ